MTRVLAALVAALLCFGSRSAHAQGAPVEAGAVVRALSSADAEAMLESAADRLEIALFGSTRRYSRSQAGFVLEEFFRRYPPREVRRLEATGTGQGWFESISYGYLRGTRPLRLYLRMRRQDARWILSELIVREEA